MHIIHEIMHPFADKLGFKPIFSRQLTKETPPYRRLEWVVMALAGEVMMPYESTKGMGMEIILEIGYHHEPSLGKGDVLHIHIHQKPGIDHHNDSTTVKRKLTRAEYERYKSFFKGVTIDERKYFS